MENKVENKKKRIIKTEQERIDELNAAIKRIRKAHESKSRKLETRQKILVGSAMLTCMKSMDKEKRESWIACLKNNMAEKDRLIAFPENSTPQAAEIITSEESGRAISETN